MHLVRHWLKSEQLGVDIKRLYKTVSKLKFETVCYFRIMHITCGVFMKDCYLTTNNY